MGEGIKLGGGGLQIQGTKKKYIASEFIKSGSFIQINSTPEILNTGTAPTDKYGYNSYEDRLYYAEINSSYQLVLNTYITTNGTIELLRNDVIETLTSNDSISRVLCPTRNQVLILIYSTTGYALKAIVCNVEDTSIQHSTQLQLLTSSYAGRYGIFSEAYYIDGNKIVLFTDYSYSSFTYAYYCYGILLDCSNLTSLNIITSTNLGKVAGRYNHYVRLNKNTWIYHNSTTDSTPVGNFVGVQLNSDNTFSYTPKGTSRNSMVDSVSSAVLKRIDDNRCIYMGPGGVNLYAYAGIVKFTDINTAPDVGIATSLVNTTGIGYCSSGDVYDENTAYMSYSGSSSGSYYHLTRLKISDMKVSKGADYSKSHLCSSPTRTLAIKDSNVIACVTMVYDDTDALNKILVFNNSGGLLNTLTFGASGQDPGANSFPLLVKSLDRFLFVQPNILSGLLRLESVSKYLSYISGVALQSKNANETIKVIVP